MQLVSLFLKTDMTVVDPITVWYRIFEDEQWITETKPNKPLEPNRALLAAGV